MLQDIFRIPLPFHLPIIGDQIVIHGFGLMLVIGFLCAMAVAKFLARRSGQDPEVFANAALLALFAGVLGERLSHVFENLDEFTDPKLGFFGNLANVFNISSGGLTYYGGFLLAHPTLMIYAIVKKVPLLLGMDIIAPCLMIGLGFGRIGCFLNGCCYGAECKLPWAVSFPYNSYAYQDEFRHEQIKAPAALMTPVGSTGKWRLLTSEELRDGYTLAYNPADPHRPLKVPIESEKLSAARRYAGMERSAPLHPAQLYSAITALLLAGLTLAYFTMPHVPGMVFALMMIVEGIARFTLELLRVEPPVLHIAGHGWSLSMVLSVILVIAGIFLAISFKSIDDSPQPSPRTALAA